ncbi:hypothetical protein WMY93_010704 [Mugilogobius chulae]|uniref:LRRNT domain-containing protein n=1 Tax=Mugilogobius chulae TaxID=88201 RepID=A0AAW0P9B2_9GOBI
MYTCRSPKRTTTRTELSKAELSAVCSDWPSSSTPNSVSALPTFAHSPFRHHNKLDHAFSCLFSLSVAFTSEQCITTLLYIIYSMRCVSWLLLGTSLLVLGPAVTGAPGQCPNLCHCHGDLLHVICDNVGLKKIPRVSEATRLVNLQRNNLGNIPTGAFSESKGLISLHMQHCQLKEIGSQAFKGLTKLVYLYLSNNEITIIKPGAFEDLTQLTYLHLDGNHITELAKGLFSPMINLFILQLNNNKLKELRPGTFAGAKDLRWLPLPTIL